MHLSQTRKKFLEENGVDPFYEKDSFYLIWTMKDLHHISDHFLKY